jgi:hypothetical protein
MDREGPYAGELGRRIRANDVEPERRVAGGPAASLASQCVPSRPTSVDQRALLAVRPAWEADGSKSARIAWVRAGSLLVANGRVLVAQGRSSGSVIGGPASG